jgi:hypothetical protein
VPFLFIQKEFMSDIFPKHLNLEFVANPSIHLQNEELVLCHVEHDDYGNKLRAIPLQTNQAGHITLDFKKVFVF